jgi:large subunit ribosomal protein L14e
VKKYVEEAGIIAKWDLSAWAKKCAAAEKRRTLSDFESFQVLVHKKSRRDKARKVIKAAELGESRIW